MDYFKDREPKSYNLLVQAAGQTNNPFNHKRCLQYIQTHSVGPKLILHKTISAMSTQSLEASQTPCCHPTGIQFGCQQDLLCLKQLHVEVSTSLHSLFNTPHLRRLSRFKAAWDEWEQSDTAAVRLNSQQAPWHLLSTWADQSEHHPPSELTSN